MNPLKEPVKALAHTAQYKTHKYFARRPYNVFSNLVSHYSKPGDIVLDCFCGGGVTIAESLKLGRKVIGVDVNPLATFITEMQIQQVDLFDFENFINKFYDSCVEKYISRYEVEFEGVTYNTIWVEYAYLVSCPCCNSAVALSDDNKLRNGVYQCVNSFCDTNRDLISKGFKRTKGKPVGSMPIRIKLEHGGLSKVIEVTPHIVEQINNQQHNDIVDMDLNAAIPRNWDRTMEDCLYEKGVYSFGDLYTKRNLNINLSIFNDIISLRHNQSKKYTDLAYYAFSASLRYTNNMSRVTANWENGNPTCMDKHAYWLPNVYVETNVLDYLKNRIDALRKSLVYLSKNIPTKKNKANNFDDLVLDKDYLILNQSSDSLDIPDKSVSLVLTDPPYGSNVQYAELSTHWNVWLKKYMGLEHFIYNDKEAVTHRKKKQDGFKSLEHYEAVLTSIYSECFRLLKDDGYLVFTFNNKDINVWIALLSSVAKAGFYLPEDGIVFQDFIDSYKNTSHLRFEGNIRGDFVYSFKKRNIQEQHITASSVDIFDAISSNIDETLTNIFKVTPAVSNTLLYTKIFTNLVNVILDYVVSHGEESTLEKIEGVFKNQFIDSILNQRLQFSGGEWMVINA